MSSSIRKKNSIGLTSTIIIQTREKIQWKHALDVIAMENGQKHTTIFYRFYSKNSYNIDIYSKNDYIITYYYRYNGNGDLNECCRSC